DGVGSPITGIKVAWKRPRGIPATVAGPGGGQPGGGRFGGIRGYTLWRMDDTQTGIAGVVGSTPGDIREVVDEPFLAHTNGLGWQPPNTPGDTPGEPAAPGAAIPGLVAGHRYRFQSQAVFLTEQDFNGDGTPDDLTLNGPLSQFSNPVTALQPGLILDP